MKKGIRVYNLYPKLLGTMDRWIERFDDIKNMNFDWVYINPFHSTSLSIYAVKDYYGYNPMFLKGIVGPEDYEQGNIDAMKETGNEMLRKVCDEARAKGMNIMMDLVINHTASDSRLVNEHPEWYERKEDGSIKHPGALDGNEWIEWGDLVQLDTLNSTDKDGLWEYWLDMILFYCSLGIRGFRCDAAYHISPRLWNFLIGNVKSKYPDAIFVAETLGCTPAELIETADSGFEYVMNSFKWWDLQADYFLRDYAMWAGKYPSLTFPENHDTVRFSEESGGNKDAAIMKYALGAYFCSSTAITIGFEYGFKKRINVVQTNPEWWEEATYNITKEIARINEIKTSYQVLQEDNMIDVIYFGDHNIFAFTKESLDGKEKVFVVVNKDWNHKHTFNYNGFGHLLGSDNIQDISHGYRMENVPSDIHYELEPCEVKIFYAKKK